MHSSDSQQKVPQDVVAIFHTSFHPTQGNIIDWSLKASDDLDLTHVEFSCLPSGLHLIDRDVVYFNKGDHQGVCIFRRRKTAEHGHRGFRLSSLGILLAKSPRPRPWQHVSALKALVETIYSSLEDRDALEPVHSDWDPARTFFEDRKARQPDLGGTGEWKGWSAELDSDAPDSNPTIHLPHMLRILGPSSLTLYKHILARRRILIITLPPVEAACILCQVAADICYEEQADGEGSGSSDDETQRRTKGKCKEGMKVLGMINLNDLDRLEEENKSGRGWIACTTDSIFLDKPSYYDLLIDLRSSTPNTRPAFYVPKLVEQPNGRAPSYRVSGVRFTWSDVKLWTELDRLLQLDSEDQVEDCCDPSPHGPPGSSSRASANSSWTDVWRVYEDVCVMCAGLWMGGWRGSPVSASAYAGSSRRMENWGSIRLDGEDNLALRARSNPYVRSVGLGIEGRPTCQTPPPPPPGRAQRAMRRSSNMSVWTWVNGKGDTQSSQESSEEPAGSGSGFKTASSADGADVSPDARRDRQILTTMALLQTFHSNTTTMLARLAYLIVLRQQQSTRRSEEVVVLTPKDIMSFELAPFSGLDARFVEWLGDEYGGGVKVLVRRGWRDLVGLVLGFG